VYVCVCNALREAEVREAAAANPGATPEEVYAILGVEPDCGSCLDYAESLISETHALIDPPHNVVAFG